MKPVSLLQGIVGLVLCAGCLAALILNCASDADAVTNLAACVGFVVLAVVGADGMKKGLSGPHQKG